MGLNVALVDQARRVFDEPLGHKVEGTTRFTTLHSEWFKARLTLETRPEQFDSINSRRAVIETPKLLFGYKDLSGQPVTLTSSDRVEIKSKQLGNNVYEVVEEPTPLRKKRRVIGYEVTLTRVDEHDFGDRAV